MIVDSIQCLEKYAAIHPLFPKAFAFFKRLTEENVPDGKYVMPDCETENSVYVILGTKALPEKTQLSAESHKRYIDIQIVLAGEEIMCVPAEVIPAPLAPYDEGKDACLYECVARSTCHDLKITAGSFAIFFAEELHIPQVAACGETNAVRKAIIKVLAK